MKVCELQKFLEGCNPNAEVYLQKDPEGNAYSPLYVASDTCVFEAGEMYDLGWTAKEACMEESEWENFREKESCVVLVPGY